LSSQLPYEKQQIGRYQSAAILPATDGILAQPAGPAIASPSSIYDFSALQYEQEVPLSKYKGQVLVIVNIASE
jgi:hypothetical protein